MVTSLPERFNRRVTLTDGRVLTYAEVGDPGGEPLVLFHGTPSSRLDAYWLDDPARRAGWRIIAPDRPGHGGSSPQEGRSLVDWPADVTELADALGLGQFAVLGFSGGAPYALVTAHRLADRITVVGLVSGWGPPDRPGAYRGVPRAEAVFDAIARRAPRMTWAGFTALRTLLLRAPRTGSWLIGQRVSAGRSEARSLRPAPVLDPSDPVREALRQGAKGPTEDLHLIVRPWGFPVGDVRAPVRIWHGADDTEVPIHHAEFLSRIVNDGRLDVIEDRDHLVLFTEADAILTGLAAGLRPD
jgi:pimeloyl-ACP methyl ester carboxylesterase